MAENEILEQKLITVEEDILRLQTDTLAYYREISTYYKNLADNLEYENNYLKQNKTIWEEGEEVNPEEEESTEEEEGQGDHAVVGIGEESIISGSGPGGTDTVTQVMYSEMNSGNVAIYCPTEMIYKETSDVFGLIADLMSDDFLRSKMIENLKEHNENFTDESIRDNDLLIRKIDYYGLVEIKLMDSDNTGFDIIQVHEIDRQRVQEGMEGWHWKVTPNSEELHQQLVFKVIIYKLDGTMDDSFSKTYQVNIKVRSWRFFHNTRILIIENPEWAFGSLILPFIAFLWGRYQGNRKRNQNA